MMQPSIEILKDIFETHPVVFTTLLRKGVVIHNPFPLFL